MILSTHFSATKKGEIDNNVDDNFNEINTASKYVKKICHCVLFASSWLSAQSNGFLPGDLSNGRYGACWGERERLNQFTIH